MHVKNLSWVVGLVAVKALTYELHHFHAYQTRKEASTFIMLLHFPQCINWTTNACVSYLWVKVGTERVQIIQNHRTLCYVQLGKCWTRSKTPIHPRKTSEREGLVLIHAQIRVCGWKVILYYRFGLTVRDWSCCPVDKQAECSTWWGREMRHTGWRGQCWGGSLWTPGEPAKTREEI